MKKFIEKVRVFIKGKKEINSKLRFIPILGMLFGVPIIKVEYPTEYNFVKMIKYEFGRFVNILYHFVGIIFLNMLFLILWFYISTI